MNRMKMGQWPTNGLLTKCTQLISYNQCINKQNECNIMLRNSKSQKEKKTNPSSLFENEKNIQKLKPERPLQSEPRLDVYDYQNRY